MDEGCDFEAYEQRCQELCSSTAPETELTQVDYAPFDLVTITRVRDAQGEPTEWVTIEGLRDGGARGVQVRYLAHWHQMNVHLERFHGKRLTDPMSAMEFAHATIQTAVTILMD